MNAEHDGELGARVEDVAQEAIDATSTTYTSDADIDVEEHLLWQLSSRGITAVGDEWLAEVAQAIRSGHHVEVGAPDGSMRASVESAVQGVRGSVDGMR